MATVNSREVVDEIIKGDGLYPGDHIRVVKIVEYTNDWGGQCYGLIYSGEPRDKYHESLICSQSKDHLGVSLNEASF